MGEMRAVTYDGRLRFVERFPIPEPREGEALVRVRYAGICNTDFEILKGYMGYEGIIGHEFVGTVERVDADEYKHLKGKDVVGSINVGCGRCAMCVSGMERHCQDRTVMGIFGQSGAMADYITLPAKNLHIVPDNVDPEEAVFTEPLAAAYEILEQVSVKPTDRVLILGDGKLGLLAAMVLNLTMADVLLVGKYPAKLFVAQNQGLNVMELENLPADRVWDVVVEATGSPDGFKTAMSIVKPRGTIVLKSTVAEAYELNLSPLVIDEITVVGSRCGSFEPALRAISRGLVNVRPLITAMFPFERASDAFDKAVEPGSLKVLINFTD